MSSSLASSPTSKIPARPACLACGDSRIADRHSVREMMFGTREEFTYQECAHCGSLQIVTFPDDLPRHYPQHYFAFRKNSNPFSRAVRRLVDASRVRHELVSPNLTGALAAKFSKPLDYVAWIKSAKLDQSARILDVGCGEGKLLKRMWLGGFTDCTGIDPFLSEDRQLETGLSLKKCEVHELAATSSQPFDLIMFHHSLEHLPDPNEAIAAASRLLTERGSLLIRLPVADCVARQYFKTDWVEWDAPRHLFIPSSTGMELLAARFDLCVKEVRSVSTVGQFAGSELYRRGISGNDDSRKKQIFTRAELDAYRVWTDQVNRQGSGDQREFYFTKVAIRAERRAA
ncbi:MAG: class I SAM-dependent methyltransferase [Planctomycetaceae bacterium]